MKKVLSSPSWLTVGILLVSLCLVRGISASSESENGCDENIGHGYKVKWADYDSNGKVLTAKLSLVKSSAVYGSDVKSLILTARLIGEASWCTESSSGQDAEIV